MVAKVETIKKKIKSGKKLGFSEKAQAKARGLIPRTSDKNKGRKVGAANYGKSSKKKK